MRKCLLLFILTFLLAGFVTAQPLRPKLVIGLVIDQMRWDYLYRYKPNFGKGGFNRLIQKGFSYENTHIPYTPSVTSAGHSSIYTGSVPAIHGIVGNDWLDKETNAYMYCAADPSVRSVGTYSLQGKMSPRNLLTTTVGDELRLATNFRSRVFGIALKDRGGIVAAGHSANACYWFDDSTGNWISSTYYMEQLTPWVEQYNKTKKPDSLMRKDWNLVKPLSAYRQSTTDDKVYEKTIFHERTRTFPHSYSSMIGKNYYPFRQSPYGNTLTLDFAKQLIQKEKLGAGGQTDMLCLSLSSTDYIGHRFGPNSLEIEDTYIRLDRELEDLLNFLDRQYGQGNYLFFLSADHGAPQVPDFMKENKMPGGSLHGRSLIPELNKMLLEKFAVNNLVRAIYEYQVYLDNRKIDSLKLDGMAIRQLILRNLLDRPEVISAFDYNEFYKANLPASIREKFLKGYFYKRSGDLQFILKPQYTDVNSAGTEHGTMYAYDTHIPLVWFGWNVKAGKTSKEVFMTDIAPTICSLLKIQMPSGSIGRPLSEIAP